MARKSTRQMSSGAARLAGRSATRPAKPTRAHASATRAEDAGVEARPTRHAVTTRHAATTDLPYSGNGPSNVASRRSSFSAGESHLTPNVAATPSTRPYLTMASSSAPDGKGATGPGPTACQAARAATVDAATTPNNATPRRGRAK